MALTPFQAKVLTFLEGSPGARANEIAESLWPDSWMHNRVSNCGAGNGTRRGAGAWRAAGGQLAKLERKGWVVSAYRGGRLICYTLAGYEVMEVTGNMRYGLAPLGVTVLREHLAEKDNEGAAWQK